MSSILVRTYDPLEGRDFPVAIPDYAFVARDQSLVPISALEKTTSLYGLNTLIPWQLQRRCPRCPDIVARDIIWGARPPKAWRRSLRGICDEWKWTKKCPPHCILHGLRFRHQHYIRVISEKCFLHKLIELANRTGGGWKRRPAALTVKDTNEDERKSAAKDAELWSSTWNSAKRSGAVYLGYYPIFVFGRSKRVGLSVSQVRLMMGLMRELTRVGMRTEADKSSNGKPRSSRAESARNDKAEIITNSLVAPSGRASHKIICPFLSKDEMYVVFGGNLKTHRARGYRLFHDQHHSWLDIAGYEKSDFKNSPWQCLRSLFSDLRRVAEMFDLVAVGRHHESATWKSLDELVDCLKTGAGQDWLSECTLRIFGPADYLIRWRYVLAKKLGFRWIPGGEEAPFVDRSSKRGDPVRSGGTLRRWLRDRDWTIARLARKLGRRRETVSRHLSGRRDSPEFWRDVESLMSRRTPHPPV